MQRKQVEVLRNKLREGQGKQRDFCSQMNQSIMQSVIKVIGNGSAGGSNNNHNQTMLTNTGNNNNLNRSGINKANYINKQ